jgi:prophage antirepressor-like protein
MNQLQVFSFENKTVRTQRSENGEALWVAKDVCEILGLGDTNKALKGHPQDETNIVRDVDSQKRGVNLLAVNEAGLYRLIFKSRKEEAERFRKFVFSDVLPSIRNTGSFSLNEKASVFPAAEPVFRSLAAVAEVFGLEKNQALLYANKATKRETGVDFQNVLQIELKNHDQERCFTPTELGQRVNMSAIKFNRELQTLGLQEKRDDVWCATEIGKTYSVLLDAGKKHSDGTPIQQLKWKEAVLELVQKRAA